MTKTKRLLGFMLLAPMLMLLVTGCDREGGSLAGVPADYLSFCEDLIDAEDAANAVLGDDPNAPDTNALHERALGKAPKEIKDEMSQLVPLVKQALASEDPDSVFRTLSFRKLEDEIDRWVIDNCGIRLRNVTAVDYRFDNIPHPIWEGRFAVHLENKGRDVHELAVFKINDGVTESAADLVALPPEQVFTKLRFVEGIADGPGRSDEEVFDLEAGRYLYACFVPVGTTEEKEGTGPPHVAEGMFGELNVRPSV